MHVHLLCGFRNDIMCHIIDVHPSLTRCSQKPAGVYEKMKGTWCLFIPFGLSHSILTPLHHQSVSPYPPPLFRSPPLCSPLFEDAQGQQLATGEQTVFGVCSVSNGIVLGVSGCHCARLGAAFWVPVLRPGRVRGSKGAPWRVLKGALEDGPTHTHSHKHT